MCWLEVQKDGSFSDKTLGVLDGFCCFLKPRDQKNNLVYGYLHVLVSAVVTTMCEKICTVILATKCHSPEQSDLS